MLLLQRTPQSAFLPVWWSRRPFPIEQFRPRVKEGEDGDALLTNIRYYTLLRLHEVIPDRSYQSLFARIVAEFGNKVLAREYTERND